MFNAEDVERQRFGAGGHDAVLGDDAVLLAAADKFAGKEKQRALTAVDQDELIDGWAAIVIGCGSSLRVARAGQACGPLFADDDFAAGQGFVEGKKRARILLRRGDDGENGNVLVVNGIEEPPPAFAAWWRSIAEGPGAGPTNARLPRVVIPNKPRTMMLNNAGKTDRSMNSLL